LKVTDYSSGADGERMQLALKYYRDQGEFDSENKPKKLIWISQRLSLFSDDEEMFKFDQIKSTGWAV
jgi:hypothetical protein